MKKIIATIGWLIFASASFGNDGQHTGVGGNPAVPPNPSASTQASGTPRMLILPGLLLLPPDINPLDASAEDEASTNEQKKKEKAALELAQ